MWLPGCVMCFLSVPVTDLTTASLLLLKKFHSLTTNIIDYNVFNCCLLICSCMFTFEHDSSVLAIYSSFIAKSELSLMILETLNNINAVQRAGIRKLERQMSALPRDPANQRFLDTRKSPICSCCTFKSTSVSVMFCSVTHLTEIWRRCSFTLFWDDRLGFHKGRSLDQNEEHLRMSVGRWLQTWWNTLNRIRVSL